jgi:EAL domain-containing protein (putative c-di-GMP-specific phosphodiesterase class I)
LTDARKPGGGHVGLYKPRPSDQAMLLETIQAALRADAFQLLFQPIVSLQGEEEELFQSLLRLRGDGGAMHTAAEVVPAAERAGLIDDIDRWVLGRCMMVLAERNRSGRSVRIFAAQSLSALRDAGRIGWIRQQLETRRVNGDWLTLEFRLGDHFDDGTVAALATFCGEVKQLGVRVALGGVQASVAMFRALEQIPLDFMRLAPRYIVERKAELREEMRLLIADAHERGRRVIAPNVEDAQSAAQLWTAGIDYIQGNFVQQAEQELSYDFRAAAT